MQPISFSDKELIHFANQQMLSKETAKNFIATIPPDLLKRLIQLILKEPVSFPELSRAYLMLRHCDAKKLNAEKIRKWMKKAHIKDDCLRYQFAKLAAKRDGEGLCNEIKCFELADTTFKRKVAEIVLNTALTTFLSNLNEFDFIQDTLREEYFLRSLMLSSDAIDSLLKDSYFVPRLMEFPASILKLIYQKFKFAEDDIKTAQKTCKESMADDELFAYAIKQPYYKLESLGCKKLGFFIEYLPDREKNPLTAMILFLLAFEKPEELIQDPTIFSFFEEIENFSHPAARFAAIGLILKFNRMGILPQVVLSYGTKKQVTVLTDPLLFSLVLYACNAIGAKKFSEEGLKQNWKDVEFKRKMILFLSEFFLSEKLTDEDRKTIFEAWFQNKKFPSTKMLSDFSTCLTQRLTSPLKQGKDPSIILCDQLKDVLDRLGHPYDRKISSELLIKLPFRGETVSYAQGLEKLPIMDKDLIVPFFFKFLNTLAEGTLEANRYKTPEMISLFATYSLDLSVWKSNTSSTVRDLFSRHQVKGLEEQINFTPFDALQKVFEENHLRKELYSDFYQAAFEKGDPKKLLLEGKYFGQLMSLMKAGQTNEDNIDYQKVVTHLLVNLLLKTEIKEQLRFAKQLSKLFPSDHDFRIDLNQWISHLENRIRSINEGFEDYVIVKSGDPKTLFSIGSVAGESCQRLKGGDPSKNKALLSYPCDGKNQVIYAENGGEIKARAILRFFYACNELDEHLFPVLYIEPFYPSGASTILRKAMTLSAIECAQKLGVPLVRHCVPKEDSNFTHNLATINGPAPYEYFDGIIKKIKSNDTSETSTVCTIDCSRIKLIFDPKNPIRLNLKEKIVI